MKIAGVRFRENWKVYDFDASDVDVAVGDSVIVDSDRGLGFARVVRLREGAALEIAPPVEEKKAPPPEEEEEIEIDIDDVAAGAPPPEKKGPKGFRRILRKATEEDIRKEEKNRSREAEAFTLCQEMITERELPMKLIRVEYSFDASRATFFFFSETRIDFRELVKDLAHKLRSRIEMRQIGVRDVARMIGGYGPCGRELCCATFLKGFEPVSIRMAKKQDMVLNPAKISGVCGRLLCCLSYEYQIYDEIKKDVAGMKEAAEREKKEEQERRVAEVRREEEERRIAEDKRRQEEQRRVQEARREKQRGPERKGERAPEKRKEQQERKGRPPQEQPRAGQEQPQQQRPEAQQQPRQQGEQQQGEKSGRKKRRRFWRNKKKKQQGEGPNPPKAD
jgi:cell fate regulator YaaT (PSP1 superfamily)